MPDPSPPPSTPADARAFFISRAGKDKNLGKAIAEWLEKAGYTTFIQDWDIEPGDDFLAEFMTL